MNYTRRFHALKNHIAVKIESRDLLWLAGALLVAAALKLWLVAGGYVPFNSDEAIVGLMARHILQGERPIFFYGQAYMGSLDAWLVAGGFALFGDRVLSIRLVQIGLYALYIFTLWLLARRIFIRKQIANIAVWVAAIPMVLLTTYTSATLGGYGETLVLGNLILLLGFEVIYGKGIDKYHYWIFLGLIGGLAFWTLGLAGIYLLPVAVLGLWIHRAGKIRQYILASVGFFITSAPWWYYNFVHNGEAISVLLGKSDLQLAATGPWQRLIGMTLLGIPSLLGLRLPWSPELAPPGILFLYVSIYLATLFYFISSYRKGHSNLHPGASRLLIIFSLGFFVVFVGTHYGIDATGRYFLPLCLVVIFGLAVFINAAWDRRSIFGVSLLVLVVVLNGIGILRAAISEDRITTQFDPITRFDNSYDNELIAFLREKRELRGYSNYWVAYRLAFVSDEEIIFSPRLPYKPDLSYTHNDNRYLPYDLEVNESSRVAYITSKHPELDQMIRQRFSILGVDHSEEEIGPYTVFFGLSRKIEPAEIGF
jgi:4-amino-4-deoxy-L-arabinose transferase-like glycosyltransferase